MRATRGTASWRLSRWRWLDESTAAQVTGQFVDPRAGTEPFRDLPVEVDRQLVTMPGRAPYLTPPKTAASVRTIPLPLAAALLRLAADPTR
jgi:hypothetical protein